MALLGPFLLAGGVYFLLRSLIRGGSGSDRAATASRHAFWVGLVGWLASSLLPAANAGILPISPGATVPVDIPSALAWPVLGCLAVHALGQLSYPRGSVTPRQSGNPRRVRDLLPRRLGWTVLAVFVGAAAQILWTSTLPRFAPLPYESQPDGAGGYSTVGGEGRIPGAELAGYLGGALLVLAAGTLVVLVLITRRSLLAGLTSLQDSLLRTITMNRLLRTVATVASGLGAIAGNHAARPDPALGPTSWMNPAGMLNLAVLLLMLCWPPPKLEGPNGMGRGAPTAAQPATRLSVSIGAAMGLAAFVPAPAVLFVPGAIAGGPAVLVALSAAAILAVVAGGEVLLHRNHGLETEPRHWPRQPVSPALMSMLVVSAAVLVAVIVAVAVRQAEVLVQPTWEVTALTSAGIAFLSGIPLMLARRRYSVAATVPDLDAALRAITVHRVVRTLAAFFAAQAGVLLMSSGPKLHTASPLGPERWDSVWQAASAVGVVLVTAAVVVAVIPVGASGRGAPGLSRRPASRLGA
ncbi:hypothetical protein FBY33_3959 [Arthrobacter sp. SLBN-112]|nr:hypothetical protein FBY33_3959 [Arthrobacter sp. SLBN-112]